MYRVWFLYVFVPLLIIGILESLSTNQHERIDPAHLEMMTSNFLKGFVLKRIGAEPSSIYHSRLVDLLPLIVVEFMCILQGQVPLVDL